MTTFALLRKRRPELLDTDTVGGKEREKKRDKCIVIKTHDGIEKSKLDKDVSISVKWE